MKTFNNIFSEKLNDIIIIENNHNTLIILNINNISNIDNVIFKENNLEYNNINYKCNNILTIHIDKLLNFKKNNYYIKIISNDNKIKYKLQKQQKNNNIIFLDNVNC